MHLHKQTLFNCQIWHLSILNTTKVSYHCYITVTELLTTLVVAWRLWEDYTRKKAEGKETDVYVITGSTPGAEMYAHAYRGYIFIVYVISLLMHAQAA